MEALSELLTEVGILSLMLSGKEGVANNIVTCAILAILSAIYMLPTIFAHANGKRNRAAIFVLNLFLGWIILGWVVALVWSVIKDSEQVVHYVPLTDPRQLKETS